MTKPTLILCDLNKALCEEWRKAFDGTDFTVYHGNILDLIQDVDALVAPGNSFGIMDGGIDLVYRNRFGMELQQTVQSAISGLFGGILPVGRAVLASATPVDLIYAPTMLTPRPIVDDRDVRLAMRAAIGVVLNYLGADTRIACPGLGTFSGRVPPDRAALRMREGYDDALSDSNPLTTWDQVKAAGWFSRSDQGGWL